MKTFGLGGKPSHAVIIEDEDKDGVMAYAASLKSLESTDDDGRTLLHWAASFGKHEIVSQLLALGASPCPEDDSGWTPLISAASGGHIEVMKLLLPKLDDDDICAATSQNRTAVFYAASKGRLEVLKLLLPAAKPSINKGEKSSQNTALHRAVVTEKEEVVEFLLDNGSSLSSRNRYRETPLHVAVQEDLIPIAKILLSRGAFEKCEDENLFPAVKSSAMLSLLKSHQQN
eukprot:CAMPEP_0201518476 /NCGR_PEP_ID=MMETSP0161_2-20130828/9315_1 /ASSEMBLY_ACC=CAM_ASM_000251 /TAXON_ID=180227 /ORGANISM="Neoparamoeba aestuarina, Strain SoJaBio B1-5/56/2" /LENGTH=229 /DNA_ID=CAMNT_0047916265 /DNA_START=50 /DNA_END=739 /DNA_ORIENTATION=-